MSRTKTTIIQSSQDAIEIAEAEGFFKLKTLEAREQFLTDQAFDETDKSLILDELASREEAKRIKAERKRIREEKQASKPLTGGVLSATDHITEYPRGKYVLTTAQNNTEVDKQMFAASLVFCEANNAQLLIAKTTYNKSGFQQPSLDNDELFYADEVKPFLVEGQIDLGGIHFCANANVIPTARNPLSGFEAVTQAGIDVVIPAVKIALKCTASLKAGKGKNLFSTGAITLRNYILRKAGAVAATEHNIGALFVDTTGAQPVVRQLERMPNSDGFYDDNRYYRAEGVTYANAEALQFGDIHAEKMEAVNLAKCVEAIKYYNTANVIVHDVLDFSSRNHHNVKDCTFMFDQTVKENTVKKDLQILAKTLDTLQEALFQANGGQMHIIESNHDLAINTWLKNADFKEDPVNALTYLTCMTALYTHLEKKSGSDFNMLKFAYKKIGKGSYQDYIKFHETDESLIIAGVEMGCHGHVGINGSRGSPAQFRSLGIPLNTGHTHTPSIIGGCYTAGVTGSLEMGYNVGPSSWRLANIVTWPNGQRQIIFI